MQTFISGENQELERLEAPSFIRSPSVEVEQTSECLKSSALASVGE